MNTTLSATATTQSSPIFKWQLDSRVSEATRRYLNKSIGQIEDLIADNELPRYDKSIVELEKAKALMKEAFSIVCKYTH